MRKCPQPLELSELCCSCLRGSSKSHPWGQEEPKELPCWGSWPRPHSQQQHSDGKLMSHRHAQPFCLVQESKNYSWLSLHPQLCTQATHNYSAASAQSKPTSLGRTLVPYKALGEFFPMLPRAAAATALFPGEPLDARAILGTSLQHSPASILPQAQGQAVSGQHTPKSGKCRCLNHQQHELGFTCGEGLKEPKFISSRKFYIQILSPRGTELFL